MEQLIKQKIILKESITKENFCEKKQCETDFVQSQTSQVKVYDILTNPIAEIKSYK